MVTCKHKFRVRLISLPELAGVVLARAPHLALGVESANEEAPDADLRNNFV